MRLTRIQPQNRSSKQPSIELDVQLRRTLDLMEQTDKGVFITGRAGTGKSTLLDYFRRTTKKKVAILAPTGYPASLL